MACCASASLVATLTVLLLCPPVDAQVRWVGNFGEAKKQAQAEEKFIVIDISASWCPPCQKMAREVHPNPRFIEFSRDQVFMLLDAELDREGVRLARKFDVHVYPTILVLDGEGNEIHRLTGGRDAVSLIRELTEIFKDPVPYQELVNQAKSAPKDFDLQYKVGKRSLDRDDYENARKFLGNANQLSAARSLDERAIVLVYFSLACFKGGEYQDSLDAMDEVERMSPDIVAEVDWLWFQRAQVLTALKRYDEAFEIANRMLRSARSRSEREEANDLLTRLPKKYRKTGKEYTEALKKAEKSFEKGKVDEALGHAQRATAIAPQAAEAHFLIANIHLQSSSKVHDQNKKNEHLAVGLSELRLARRLDPEDLRSYIAAKAYLAYRFMPQRPKSQEADELYSEAEDRFAKGRYEDAVKRYMKVVQLEPQFGKAYLHLGDCVFASGNLEEALKFYKQAMRVTPLDPAAYRFAADTLLELGRTDESRGYILQSILADPEYPLAWKNLEEFAKAEGSSFRRHAEIIPNRFLFLGFDDEAYDERMFDSVAPASVPAWREYTRNKLLWRQKKFSEVFPQSPFYHTTYQEELDCIGRLVEKWSAMRDENPDLRNEGLDFLRQVKLDNQLEAFVFLELFTEEYRPSYEPWRKENEQRALSYVSNHIMSRRAPQSGGRYNSAAVKAFNAGLESQRNGDIDKALESYHEVLLQEPFMIPAMHNMTQIYLQQQELENARETIQRWSVADPESASLFSLKAQLAYLEGNLEMSASLLERAILLEQDSQIKESYRKNLSNIQSTLDRGAQPVIVPSRPKRKNARLEALALAISEGESESAIPELEKLIPKLPEGSDQNRAYLMLGLAYYEMGDKKAARKYLELLLSKDPKNDIARELLLSLPNESTAVVRR